MGFDLGPDRRVWLPVQILAVGGDRFLWTVEVFQDPTDVVLYHRRWMSIPGPSQEGERRFMLSVSVERFRLLEESQGRLSPVWVTVLGRCQRCRSQETGECEPKDSVRESVPHLAIVYHSSAAIRAFFGT